MELLTAPGKMKKYFFTTTDVTTFKFLSHARQHGCTDILHCCNDGNGWTYYYVTPLPGDRADLKARIIVTVKNINAPMLTRVWQELEYRIDVRRVTHGAHIEHL
jgi:hypothetical protein